MDKKSLSSWMAKVYLGLWHHEQDSFMVHHEKVLFDM